MGDVLWIEPIIRHLSVKNKKVIVFTKFNALFENFPFTNVVFKDNLNIIEKVLARIESLLGTSLFFINLDRTYEKQPKQHFLHAYQQKAGLEKINEYPILYLSEKEKVNDNSPAYAIIHIESYSDRNYRKVYGIDWSKIVSYIKSKGFVVIQVGKNPAEIPGCKSLKSDIRQLIKIINGCSFFIGIDSGPSHIAASLHKPSLVFFGAVNPEYRHFKENFNGIFMNQFCEFSGCYHNKPGKIDPYCRLVPDNEVPKCALYTNEYLINMIDLLLEKYTITR